MITCGWLAASDSPQRTTVVSAAPASEAPNPVASNAARAATRAMTFPLLIAAALVAGVILGFGFYVANQVFGPMSLVYAVPPLLGAIMPSVLFMGVAVWLLRRHRA